MPSFLSLERGEMKLGFLLEQLLESVNFQYPVAVVSGN